MLKTSDWSTESLNNYQIYFHNNYSYGDKTASGNPEQMNIQALSKIKKK